MLRAFETLEGAESFRDSRSDVNRARLMLTHGSHPARQAGAYFVHDGWLPEYHERAAVEVERERYLPADRKPDDACTCCKHERGYVNCAQVDCLRCDAEECWQCPACKRDGWTPSDVVSLEDAGETELCWECAEAATNDTCRGCGAVVDGCAGECDACFGGGR